MKLVKLMSMCLNEIYNRVWIHTHFFATFPIKNGLKQGNTSSSLLVKFGLVCAIYKVQEDQEGFKLNGTSALIHIHQVNLLGESVHTTRQNREALLVTSREIGLGVHAEKTKYTYVHVS